MKYIRTKDGILVDVSLMTECETDDDKGNRIFDGYEDSKGNYYPVENIIKQVNTIEELCDGLLVEDKYNSSNWFIMEIDEFKKEKTHLREWYYYAFIKTDKGLIYKAKMKGVLPNGEIDWELL